MKSILIIDDEIHTCTLLNKLLSREGFETSSSLSGAAALQMIKNKDYQLVFCDYRLKDKEKNGADLFREIRAISPQTAVIMMTGYPDVRVAIQLTKEGLYDYIIKPLVAEHIVLLAKKAVKPCTMEGQPAGPMALPPATASYVAGNSAPARELQREIELVAPTDYSVVIFGETGTGKESVARLIHRHSKRNNKPFVALDCGSLSGSLAASELFGHEKGAFTGAIAAKAGAFREAEGGTLFLDEISNMAYDIQVALLRVMQERVVRPVGSSIEIPVNVRIVVASNDDLRQSMLAGRFREDLFYRLNEFTISVPPLRERLGDLPLFTASFMQEVESAMYRKCGPLSEEVLECFMRYSWPGNIRELKNAIRRACLLTPGDGPVTCAALPPEMLESRMAEAPAAAEAPAPELQDNSLKAVSASAELKRIMTVLKEVRYNKTKAAHIMNIDRKTLYNKLHLFNIKL